MQSKERELRDRIVRILLKNKKLDVYMIADKILEILKIGGEK